MKKINFLLSVLLLVILVIYLFSGNDFLNRASLTLHAAYSTSCGSDCSSGEVCCSDSTVYACVNSNWYNTGSCTNGCNSAGDGCAECNSTNYPLRCSSGIVTYCSSGVKKSITCDFGTCQNSTTCGECNSTSGCLPGNQCLNGTCFFQPTCKEAGGDCSVSQDVCETYGGSVLVIGGNGTVDGGVTYFTAWGCTSSEPVCCDTDANADAVECKFDGQCQIDDVCQKCINPNTIDSECVSTKTSGKDGVANSGGSSCSTPGASCSTPYGASGVSESGGYYTWTCYGQPASTSTCRTAGDSASGWATKLSNANGVCNMTKVGGCTSGTATAVTEKIVSVVQGKVGKIYNWSCLSICNGTDENCGASIINDPTPPDPIPDPLPIPIICINHQIVNGECKSNITGTSASDLCYSGTPTFDSRDANYDYINDSNESEYVWGCAGSINTCAEGDGTSKTNCVSTIDQRAWFRVNGGNILAKGSVTNYVPATCANDNKAGGCAEKSKTVNDGVVLAKSVSKSGSDGVIGFEAPFGLKFFSYNDLKSRYFSALGVGFTFPTGTTWSEIVLKIKNDSTQKVYFVNEPLIINQDLVDVASSLVMIVVNGSVTIKPNVNTINAILVASSVTAEAAEDDSTVGKLTINGLIHTYGTGVDDGIFFKRSIFPKKGNNTEPSVEINYKPELLFALPVEMTTEFSGWNVN
jgi:hypothetical protein